MPSPSLRRHPPHRISSIDCKPLSCWETLVGSVALCTGWRALPSLQVYSAGWGLGQVLAHQARSPVFFLRYTSPEELARFGAGPSITPSRTKTLSPTEVAPRTCRRPPPGSVTVATPEVMEVTSPTCSGLGGSSCKKSRYLLLMGFHPEDLAQSGPVPVQRDAAHDTHHLLVALVADVLARHDHARLGSHLHA